MNNPISMGFPLPDELIGLTFNHLDAPSLLRCMHVCKLFHSIVLGNTQLSYKIELFASGMEDSEDSSIATVSRLSLLQEYNQAWNDMKWTSSGTVPMCDGPCWEFSGGVLAQSKNETEVFFVQLPCKLNGIAERKWTVSFDFRIRDFALDNSQDLMVLLELAGNFPSMSCKFHLSTLSGDHHPQAAVAQIICAAADLHAELSFLLQICGSRLAVLCYDQYGTTSQSSFFIWNWKNGHQEVYIHTSAFQSYAFMTEDMILAATLGSDRKPALRVLRIAALANPILSLDDMPYICELQYPELQGNLDHFLIRSDPTPTWRPPAGSGVPFYSSLKNFIFTISIRVLVDETHESTVLFVPLSTLLSEVEHSGDLRNVIWDAWGPGGTRMIYREPSEIWVCYTYGMKFIQGLRWKNGHVARVYDFNPYAARRHVMADVDSHIPWKRLAKRSKLDSRCQSFGQTIETMLPGRVANVTLAHSDEGWEAIMIGENHILMVQPQSSMYGYMALK